MSNGLFVFMIAWNEFLFALLFLVENRPTVDGLAGPVAARRQHRGADTVLMAGSVILTLPIIVLFFLTERLLVGGPDRGRREGLTKRSAWPAATGAPTGCA